MTKTALITGVSSGIGLAQAGIFLENGWRVYGIDQASKPDLTGDFHFLQLDLTGDLSPVFSWCQTVDVLCNTAGILDDYRPHLDISEDELARIFAVNFFTVTRLTRPYLQQMVDRQSGIIINMCSIASSLAGGGGSAYTASKHALAGFTKQLALDYAKDKVQIFGIAPGAVQTGMTQKDFEPSGLANWVADQTPIGRWTQPSEIAELTFMLATGKLASMQGQIITIDGGWSLK
ncbi:MAG: 3-oxoacyl-ACP reductase [Streptococcus orisratti]|uniref:3-oxoacyl-ACP reductase n=1 Tax=Streptococcus orisratti TaxID=114652 RepID=UPI002A91C3ED|nr:3-oxoacyl-ACP reductase [Streptococcus orisratti]MDY5636049.1 3-oxoacyl-ACP reductase [Streptococcus orisratti]